MSLFWQKISRKVLGKYPLLLCADKLVALTKGNVLKYKLMWNNDDTFLFVNKKWD